MWSALVTHFLPEYVVSWLFSILKTQSDELTRVGFKFHVLIIIQSNVKKHGQLVIPNPRPIYLHGTAKYIKFTGTICFYHKTKQGRLPSHSKTP